MSKSEARTKHIFVVEIWREPSDSLRGSLRGIVKDVTHGQQSYVHTLGDLTDFISVRLDHPSTEMQPSDEPCS